MRRGQTALAAIGLAVAAACGAPTDSLSPASGPAALAATLAAPPSSPAVPAPPGAEVTTIRLSTGSSSTVIRRSGEAGYSIERIAHVDGPEPPPSHRLEGHTLVLEGCEVPDCWFEYEVAVPEWVDVTGDAGSGSTTIYGVARVDLHAGSGTTSVTDVAGPVSVDSGSGAVLLADIDGDVTVAAGSGGVRGSGLSGGYTRVQTGSGGVDLSFATVQSIEATTGSGSVSLVVAPGRYRVDVESRIPPEIGVENDPAAPATIDVDSDGGDVSVVAAG